MKSNFLKRIFRAIKIDPELYEEVEHDKSATLQAATVVILSSLAAGVGAISMGASNFFLGPTLSLVNWFIWAFFIFLVGTKLFPDKQTKSNVGELLRTIGFASAPGIIRVLGLTPELMLVSFVGAQFWILACMVVAVRQALDYKSLWKAFGVVFLSGFIISLVSVLIIFILK